MSIKQTLGHIRLHGIVEQLAAAYRDYLPDTLKTGDFDSQNTSIPADVRTRLAFIEDCMKAADKAVEDPLLVAAWDLLATLKRFHFAYHGPECTPGKCATVRLINAAEGGTDE